MKTLKDRVSEFRTDLIDLPRVYCSRVVIKSRDALYEEHDPSGNRKDALCYVKMNFDVKYEPNDPFLDQSVYMKGEATPFIRPVIEYTSSMGYFFICHKRANAPVYKGNAALIPQYILHLWMVQQLLRLSAV